jgi:hypothetical protein
MTTTTKSISKECSQSCIEEMAEFNIKFVVPKLDMIDEDAEESGLRDVMLILSFDSNVIRLENIEADNFPIGHVMTYQMSPERLSEKLQCSVVTVNLYRRSIDLGFLKLDISCFSEAVLCDNFVSEKVDCNHTFVFEDYGTAKMQLVVEVARTCDFINPLDNFVRKMQVGKKHAIEDDELSFNFSLMSSSCDDNNDLLTDLCPEESSRICTSYPNSSKSNKCCSDIATSLDINSFSDNQKIFCHACGGFSISGITCDNKVVLESLSKSVSFVSKASSRVDKTHCHAVKVNRICSECFEDLTVLPKDAACPKCAATKKKQQQLPSADKSNEGFKFDQKLVESCVESAIRKLLGCETEEEKVVVQKNDEEIVTPMKKKKCVKVKVCEKENLKPKTPR